MSITRIAMGVLLGNILFSIIAGFIGAIIVSEMQTQAQIKDADDSYKAMRARIQAERYQRCLLGRQAMDAADARTLPPCSLD